MSSAGSEGRRTFSVGQGLYQDRARAPRASIFTFDGRPFLRIDDVDGMPPFFMSVVSAGDRWMYSASTGGLVLGRRSPEGSLFPYETDDRLMAADGTVGARSVLFVDRGAPGGHWSRWEPQLRAADGQYDVRRALWKSSLGNELWTEEHNTDLALTLRTGWASGERFGFQRRVVLSNEGSSDVRLRVLDGLLSILPACVAPGMQASYSTLVDAYKQAELHPEASLAIFRLSSIPIDRAVPNEALRASVAWVRGLPAPQLLLSTRQLEAFRRGDQVVEEQFARGAPGALLAVSELTLAPGASQEWIVGIDAQLDAAEVVLLANDLGAASGGNGGLTPHLRRALDADLTQDRERLVQHLAAADGLQVSANAFEDARQVANTLFNLMRGGTFLDQGRIQREDFALYLRQVAPLVADRTSSADWPAELDRATLIERAQASCDRDLERLAREYLPLTFSRRHGDPSRPWNHFTIATHDRAGRPELHYEGNWRDIFQNWEALLWSYPEYAEATVVKFVNATTIDGFNPYRVTRAGFDWEVPDPNDPWSHIGYWGDHQVIYLQRLLELTERLHPSCLAALLRRPIFVYADVPYRLANFEQLTRDPYQTISFDDERAGEIEQRAAQLGNEARLRRTGMHSSGAALHYAGLAEKLIVPILSKLSHLVPGVGIWMNTQRPEWNDANNALVGDGVSVVTAAYLVRHVACVGAIIAGSGDAPIAIDEAVAQHLRATLEILERESRARTGTNPTEQRLVLDALGQAGSRYRERAYAHEPSTTVALAADELLALLDAAGEWLRATVRANLREDGLVHAYNLMALEENSLDVRRLPPMLEGQVAALMSGIFSASEAADLLDGLRASPLRRDDIGTYLLYPGRDLPRFLAKGVVPAAEVDASPLLCALLDCDDRRVVRRDADGFVRFAAELRNAEELEAALAALANDERFALLSDREADQLRAIYERVFDHRSFTDARAPSSATKVSAVCIGTWCPSCGWQCSRPGTPHAREGRTQSCWSASPLTTPTSAPVWG